MSRTTALQFLVLRVHCRHCQQPIEVSIPDGLPPDQQLAECERQAEAQHVCPKLDDMAEPEEPAVP
jgi:hypothetical protein